MHPQTSTQNKGAKGSVRVRRKVSNRHNITNANLDRIPDYVRKQRGYNQRSAKGFGPNTPFVDGSIVGGYWLSTQPDRMRRSILLRVARNHRRYFDRGNPERLDQSFRVLFIAAIRCKRPDEVSEGEMGGFWSALPDEFASELSHNEEWLFGFVSAVADEIWSDKQLTKLAARKV